MALKISSLSLMSNITAMESVTTLTADTTGFTTGIDIIVQVLDDRSRYFRCPILVIDIHFTHRMRWTHRRYMKD
ncbi:hypothetical protein Forpe1208_v007409 [Fusarium oxysporum f. sp. rapae]|uniref:Uncharacterized protein n=1 Tax=Fusarium oxysporum f. sp. rapae TaxID=485398 RepID=A0A8J5P8F1_FUSOX|nr:hypothetical protein Forpe1208_v007409 [Fusarium oxysporum f. sp. rapae]